MKHSATVWLACLLLFGSCGSKNLPVTPTQEKSILVSTPNDEPGYIYVDGKYTGSRTPARIKLSAGKHIVGVALQNSWVYLRKEVDAEKDQAILFSNADKPVPKVWKVLWIGLRETKGNSAAGECSTRFTKEELDAGYENFRWSIQNHFEPYSYGTTKWEVERIDIIEPVPLTRTGSSWFTIEPSTITRLLPVIRPGVYDCVFVFWREKEGSCSFQSNYFGLAWTNPMAESIRTGFVTVKFDAGNSVADRLHYYKTQDPGVWIHEWLHTVGENYFQQKGLILPQKAGGFTVHAAEQYNYSFPWMSWYLDFISGRVPNPFGEPQFVGIGPEALLKCSLRETALEPNCQ